MGSVSQEGNVGNVNNRGAGDSIEVSPGHGYEVGDMVWGKVKSHPWWPGHVYSEELATPSVRQSKRDGLLLVAFFGDSSYGWFDPSELIPFDSNFADKSLQTNSRTFVKALEEAKDEVSRRSALGLFCMCRNKQNFRQTDDAQGFLAVDVVGYEPGVAYSIDTIKKARDNFQPRLTLDFVRELALEPTDEHDDIDFMKNKATVMSYRRAVYEEFDETYDQAFGGDFVRPSPGSIQVSTPGKKPPIAPLSGRQVFGDTVGKVKSPTKLNKPNDHSKKDKYLFKRRDQPKETKILRIEKVNRSSSSPSQLASIEDPLIATLKVSTMEKDTHIVPESNNPPDIEINTPISSLIHKPSNVKKFVTQNHIPSPGPHKISPPEKITVLKRPAGELDSGNSVSPEKKIKTGKKESLMENASVIGDAHRNEVAGESTSGKSVSPEEKKKSKKVSLTGDDDTPQMELPRVLSDLHSFALDPLFTDNRKLRLKVRQVFLKYRSLVFQKSLNSVTKNEPNNTVVGTPPVKPQVRPPGRPDDPTKGGIKRDRHEEISAKKKRKITEIKNLRKVNGDGGKSGSGQAVVTKPRKREPEVGQRVVEPTTLKMEFPSGGSLPSISELKAKLGRYGTMDHDGTRIYWKTFTCLVVYRYKADAEVALKAVTASSNLFGNTNVKYSLNNVSNSEPPSKVSDHQPTVVDRAAVGTPDVSLKSCLKKSGGEEGDGSGGRKTSRVKFILAGDGSCNSKSFQNGVSSSTTQSTPPPPPLPSASLPTPRKSINYSMPLAPPSLPPRSVAVTPLPPPPLASPPPPQSSIQYKAPLEPPSLPARSMPVVPPPAPPWSNRPVGGATQPLAAPNMDIAQQMVSLLTRCNDVVAHVTSFLGYAPYHPL